MNPCPSRLGWIVFVFVFVFAFAGVAALAPSGRAAQVGGVESAPLARAKVKYEQDLQALSKSISELVKRRRLDLTPIVIPVKFDLVAVNEQALRMEEELRLFALEGELPASAANDIVTQTTFGGLKSAMSMEYKKAYEAAQRAGDSKARDVYVTESDAFGKLTEFANWRALLDSAQSADGAPAWIRSNGGWLSPAASEGRAGALQVRASAIPWRPQYKLELVLERVEPGEGLRISVLDPHARRVEFRLPASALDAAQKSRVFGKSGICLIVTVQESLLKLEAEGRTFELRAVEPIAQPASEPPAQPAAEPIAQPAAEPAPQTPWVEILPEGALRVRVQSIAWKPLRGLKQESRMGAEIPRPKDCASKPPLELASFSELARAKAAYDESVLQFAQELGNELRKRMQSNLGEDLAKANQRRLDLAEEERKFEVEGAWPASLRNDLAMRSKWDAVRRPLTVAYWKAGSEANRVGEPCLLQRLVLEFDEYQTTTDFGSWQPLLMHLMNGKRFDSNRPLLPLLFGGSVPPAYKVEFVVAREGAGGGFTIRGREPAGEVFEYQVSKFDLDAGVGGGVFKRGGARFLVVAQAGYARIEMEGRTLWQRPSDEERKESGAAAPSDLWLELTPDEGTLLTARSLRWKPLVLPAVVEKPAPDKPKH